MLNKVINNYLKYIKSQFNKYGIEYSETFNSDLELITEYTRNYNVRNLFKDNELIDETTIEQLKLQNKLHMIYNFSPMKLLEDRLNNIKFEVLFNPNSYQNDSDWTTKTLTEQEYELAHFVKELNAEQKNIQIRDMLYVQIDFSFKFLTSDLSLLNNLQFIYLSELVKKKGKAIEMSFNFGEGFEDLSFDYITNFNEVDSIALIDPMKYGSLCAMDFSGSIQGPIFSMYKREKEPVTGIDLKVVQMSVLEDLETE